MTLKHVPKLSLPDRDIPQDVPEKERLYALYPSQLQTRMQSCLAVISGSAGTVPGLGLLYVMTFAVLWTMGDWHHLLLALSTAPVLIWLSEHDLRRFEMPDIGTALLVIFAVVFLGVSDSQVIPLHLVTGLCVTGLLWAFGSVYFLATGVDGFGIGDAKLFGAGALLLGPWHLPELLLLSSCGGILGYWIAHVGSSSDVRDGIPFGPYIAYAIFVLSFTAPIFSWASS